METHSDDSPEEEDISSSDDDDIVDLTIPAKPYKQVSLSYRKAENPPMGRIITAIDPGPVNCGICMFDVDNYRVIRLRQVAFRERSTKITHGQLCDSVRAYVKNDPDKFFTESSKVYIECQEVGDTKKLDNVVIQIAVQTLLTTSGCVVIPSNTVKCYFRRFFPLMEGLTKHQQKELHRKNAIEWGRKTMTDDERLLIPTHGKRDDCLEAMWLARYVAESTYQIASPLPPPEPKKRKRSTKKKQLPPSPEDNSVAAPPQTKYRRIKKNAV